MPLEPIRINFDRGHPTGGCGPGGKQPVHFPVIHQGTRQELKIQIKIGEVFHDFTIYDEIVMTVRAQVQKDDVIFSLTKTGGDFVAEADALTLIFSEDKTAGVAFPGGLQPVPGPQVTEFGHDVRLIKDGTPIQLASGILVLAWAFTR